MCDTLKQRRVANRRRGSVLIMVTALLGMLFVMGVAFMASMNNESRMIESELADGGSKDGVGSVMAEVGSVLKSGLAPGGAVPFGAEDLFGSVASAYVELPFYHNVFSPIEPCPEGYDAGGNPVNTGWPWFTDLESIKTGDFKGSKFEDYPLSVRLVHGRKMSSQYTAGKWFENFPDRIPVDADGDGVVDSIQADVSEVLDIAPAQLAELSQLLNAESNPKGKVFAGLRIVPHGGMVNLNESHPALLESVYTKIGDYVHRPTLDEDEGKASYSVAVEEGQLRRRGLLPPRNVSASALHGNPGMDPDDQEDGGGDFAYQLFPPGESVFKNAHQYRPFTRNDTYPPDDPDSGMLLWEMRMDAERSFLASSGSDDEYDRRHLTTVISYDDNLARGVQDEFPYNYDATVTVKEDLHALMMEQNSKVLPQDDSTRFDYAVYPQDIPLQGCTALGDEACGFDPRKGRLKVSLPWLEKAVTDGIINEDQMKNIIQEAFTMMLYNASGPMWDDEPVNGGCLSTTEVPCTDQWRDPSNTLCRDEQLDFYPASSTHGRQTHRYAQISRTAAALTANLIDFVDQDDVPTRIEIRPSDPFYIKYYDQHHFSTPAYLFGLERQPYITEVEARFGGEEKEHGFAVELFNPYDTAIDLGTAGYKLRVRKGTAFSDVPLWSSGISINPGSFVVVVNNASKFVDLSTSPIEDSALRFSSDCTVYLIRDVANPDDPSNPNAIHEIVVDQFDLRNEFANQTDITRSIERPSVAEFEPVGFSQPASVYGSPWYAVLPVPSTSAITAPGNLGAAPSPPGWGTPQSKVPVEVRMANTGSMRTAFPTTGSLLLLMRYANHQWADRDFFDNNAAGVPELAFTTQLNSLDRCRSFDPVSGQWAGLLKERTMMIDNGRMPVFDVDFAHHVDSDSLLNSEIGDVEHLPWGQLVFDYFTALPLSSKGPSGSEFVADTIGPQDVDLPRVDMAGLRVHGRINLNVAPWTVLSGLPLMPMNTFAAWPTFWKNKVLHFGHGLLTTNDLPNGNDSYTVLGDERAKAIVAYRENKYLKQGSGATAEWTGNYRAEGRFPLDPVQSSKYRKGTGFLTVGELLNVRSSSATTLDETDSFLAGMKGSYGIDNYSFYRMDAGVVGSRAGNAHTDDFVSAIAPIIALGDWVTVRSQVFTVYGVFRGEEDLTIENEDWSENETEQVRCNDVDSRAIRVQSTIDRLPTFLGERLPDVVGESYIGRYNDFMED